MRNRTVGLPFRLPLLTLGVVVGVSSLSIRPVQAQVLIIESAPVSESAPFFDQSFDSTVPIDHQINNPSIDNTPAIANSASDMYMPSHNMYIPSHSNIYTPSHEIMRIQTPHRVYQAPTVYYQRTEIVSPDGSQRIILEDPVGYSPGYYSPGYHAPSYHSPGYNSPSDHSVPPRRLHRQGSHHDRRNHDRRNFPSSIRLPVTHTQHFIYRF